MGDIRIGTRLLLGFGVTVLLTLLMGGYALWKQSEVQALTQEIDSRDFAALDTIQEIGRGEDQMQVTRDMALLAGFLRREHLPTDPPQAREREWGQLRDKDLKLLDDLHTTALQLQKDALTPQRSEGWRKIATAIQDAEGGVNMLSPYVEGQFAALNSDNLPDALARTTDVDRAAGNYESKLSEAQQEVQGQIRLGRAEVQDVATETRNSVILVLAITVIVGIFFAMIIHRSITTPLQVFMRLVERIGQGDLTQRAATESKDEIGDLGRSLDQMVKGLKEVASQTRLAAESVNTATAEILHPRSTGRGTAGAGRTVQQANATMTEISRSGAQISERAETGRRCRRSHLHRQHGRPAIRSKHHFDYGRDS